MNEHLSIVRTRSAAAFSLIELLTVIAVVGVLATLLVGASSRVKDTRKEISCLSNIRQIGTGILAYAYDNDGTLPQFGDSYTFDVRGWWDYLVTPYVMAEGKVDVWNPVGDDVVGRNILRCPSAVPYVATDYAANTSYGANYNVVFNYVNSQLGLTGSRRIVSLPSGTFLIGDSFTRYGTPVVNSPHIWSVEDTDQEHRVHNGMSFRHSEHANVFLLNGSAKKISMKEWRDNLNGLWGPEPGAD